MDIISTYLGLSLLHAQSQFERQLSYHKIKYVWNLISYFSAFETSVYVKDMSIRVVPVESLDHISVGLYLAISSRKTSKSPNLEVA